MSPSESFAIFLGADDAIKVTYPPGVFFNDKQGLIRRSNLKALTAPLTPPLFESHTTRPFDLVCRVVCRVCRVSCLPCVVCADGEAHDHDQEHEGDGRARVRV